MDFFFFNFFVSCYSTIHFLCRCVSIIQKCQITRVKIIKFKRGKQYRNTYTTLYKYHTFD